MRENESENPHLGESCKLLKRYLARKGVGVVVAIIQDFVPRHVSDASELFGTVWFLYCELGTSDFVPAEHQPLLPPPLWANSDFLHRNYISGNHDATRRHPFHQRTKQNVRGARQVLVHEYIARSGT
jgi:hypothetical protein